MPEYIEREALIEFVKQNTPNINGETSIKCVDRAIRAIPAADVVEVVRCKNCKHYEQYATGCAEMVCGLDDLFCNPDDYCSYGERKDGDEE